MPIGIRLTARIQLILFPCHKAAVNGAHQQTQHSPEKERRQPAPSFTRLSRNRICRKAVAAQCFSEKKGE